MQQDFQGGFNQPAAWVLVGIGRIALWMLGMLTWYLVELPKPVEANNV
jgi:hypothetical protein